MARNRKSAKPGERSPRNATMLAVRCERQDGSTPTIRVRNLSARGLCAHCAHIADFAVGEALHIAFANLEPVAASIVWLRNRQVGIAFRNPVDLETLAEARSAGGEAAPGIDRRAAMMRDWMGLTRVA